MNAGDFVLSYHQIYVQNALDIYHIVTCKMSWEFKLFSGMFQNRSNIVQNSKNSEERDYVNLELRVCIHYNHPVFLYQMYSLQTVFGRPPPPGVSLRCIWDMHILFNVEERTIQKTASEFQQFCGTTRSSFHQL